LPGLSDPCFFLYQARTTICWGYLSQMDTQFSGLLRRVLYPLLLGIDSSSDESAISIPRGCRNCSQPGQDRIAVIYMI
jgi:hypothetical protein